MKLIVHRRNSTADLVSTPLHYGVEIDIRSQGGELIIQHHPFKPGELLKTWIEAYRHGTLILNVKEEGLEFALIDLMKSYHISDFFFLDQSFPFLLKWSKTGERRIAVRISEFECIDTVLNLQGLVDWVWVDCFTHCPLNYADSIKLKQAGFKLCFVSPELHGRDAEIEIPATWAYLNEKKILADAVCTKRPDLWEKQSCC